MSSSQPGGYIILTETDNVATATRDAAKGEVYWVKSRGATYRVELKDDIPAGHKFSLVEICGGAAIIKYGEAIGAASRLIASGEHVHIHNAEGTRGRGDRP